MFDRQAYMRAWYLRVVKPRRKKWLKEHGPCVDCGSSSRLEVDHDDPSKKVSHNVWSWSDKKRESELAKCKIRCHRCHKRKTHGENIKRDIWKNLRKQTAHCSKCDKDLPTGYFHKDRYACNGLYSACKNCRRKLPSRGWKGNWKKKECAPVESIG